MRRAVSSKYLPAASWRARELQEIMFKEAIAAHQRGDSIHTTSAPPGVGKSVTQLLEAALLLTRGIRTLDGSRRTVKGVIIATPLLDIMRNYTEVATVEVPSGPDSRSQWSPYIVDIQALWRQNVQAAGTSSATRDSNGSATRPEMKAFFGPNGGGLLIVSHQALLKNADIFPSNLSEYHLCLDEAHHAPNPKAMRRSTRTGDVRDLWLEQGGTVSQWSATTWHTQSLVSIIGDNDRPCLISVLESQRADLVPQVFQYNHVTLDIEAADLKALLMQGKPTQSLVNAYVAVAKHWKATGSPYTLTRLPDRRHIESCKKAFEKAGARVLVVAGDDFDREALRHEQKLTDYSQRRYDVILACRRFDEGVDVPAISNVYYIGAPTSARLVIQLWGRAWRRKKDLLKYPLAWKDRCAFTVFVPRGPHALDAYLQAHGRQAIILATYLSDVSVGERMLSLRDELYEGISQTYQQGTTTQKNRTVAQRARLAEIFGDEYQQAEAVGDLNKILVQTARERGEDVEKVNVRAVLQKIRETTDVKSRVRLFTVCQKLWQTLPDIPSQRAAKALGKIIKEEIEQAQFDQSFDDRVHDILQEMEDAILTVAAELSDIHDAFYLTVDQRLWKIISTFTASTLEDVRKAMRRLISPGPRAHEVAACLRAYWKRHQTYPTEKSGGTGSYGLEGYTFAQIADNWLSFGLPETTMAAYGRRLQGTPLSKRTQRRRKSRP